MKWWSVDTLNKSVPHFFYWGVTSPIGLRGSFSYTRIRFTSDFFHWIIMRQSPAYTSRRFLQKIISIFHLPPVSSIVFQMLRCWYTILRSVLINRKGCLEHFVFLCCLVRNAPFFVPSPPPGIGYAGRDK